MRKGEKKHKQTKVKIERNHKSRLAGEELLEKKTEDNEEKIGRND